MKEFYKILSSLDDYDALEEPFPSNRVTSLPSDVKHLKEEINQTFGFNLSLTTHQDSSHYGELYSKSDPERSIYIRISNFGKMVTVRVYPQDSEDDYPIEKIIDKIVNLGFIYIPFGVLQTEYTGHNSRLRTSWRPQPTWWDRYFDYI